MKTRRREPAWPGPARDREPLPRPEPVDRVGDHALLARRQGVDDRAAAARLGEHPRRRGVRRLETGRGRPAVRQRQLGDEAGSPDAHDVEDDRDDELGACRPLRGGAERREGSGSVEAVPRDAVPPVRDRRPRAAHRRLHLGRPPQRLGAEEERGDARGVGCGAGRPPEAGDEAAPLPRRLGAVRRGEDVEAVARVRVAGDLVGGGGAVGAARRKALPPPEELRADGGVVDRADGEGVADAGGQDDAGRAAAVAARRHDEDARLGEEVEGRLVVGRQGVAVPRVRGPGVVEVAAERHVDDADAPGVPGGEAREDGVEPLEDVRVGPFSPVVEDADGRHPRAAGDARHEPRDDPRDRRPVSVAVDGVAVAVDGVVEVDRLRAEGELGVRVVDPRVDHGDRDALPVDARRAQLGDPHERLALGIEGPDLPVGAHALDARVAREGRHGRPRDAQEKGRHRLVRPRDADAERRVVALEVLAEPLQEGVPGTQRGTANADAPGLLGEPERDEDFDLAFAPRPQVEKPRVGLLDGAAGVGERPEPLRREWWSGRRRHGEGEHEKRGGGVGPHRSPNGK